MLKVFKHKNEKNKAIFGLIVCAIVLIIGYLILRFIATQEEPPLGNTFQILLGTTLCSVSGLGIILIIKYMYDSNKRRKRRQNKRKKHKVVFLKK